MQSLSSRSQRFLSPIALACIALVVGCGGKSEFELAPVSGRVTLDGNPVPYTQVIFTPQSREGVINVGPGSIAFCNDDGTFELKTNRGEDGAVVGKHVVHISSKGPVKPPVGDQDVGPPPKDAFPARFNENSELTFEVPADGTTAADFKLTTAP
jgi:hypothetical protein